MSVSTGEKRQNLSILQSLLLSVHFQTTRGHSSKLQTWLWTRPAKLVYVFAAWPYLIYYFWVLSRLSRNISFVEKGGGNWVKKWLSNRRKWAKNEQNCLKVDTRWLKMDSNEQILTEIWQKMDRNELRIVKVNKKRPKHCIKIAMTVRENTMKWLELYANCIKNEL